MLMLRRDSIILGYAAVLSSLFASFLVFYQRNSELEFLPALGTGVSLSIYIINFRMLLQVPLGAENLSARATRDGLLRLTMGATRVSLQRLSVGKLGSTHITEKWFAVTVRGDVALKIFTVGECPFTKWAPFWKLFAFSMYSADMASKAVI